MKLIPMVGVLKGKDWWEIDARKRQKRLSLIGALCQNQFLAPLVYPGYCTARLIEAWLEKVLLPEVEPGKVIIMDNAPFHNSKRIRKLIEKAGCELLFLPTYSPDLNPIEHWWHKIKTAIRKELPLFNERYRTSYRCRFPVFVNTIARSAIL